MSLRLAQVADGVPIWFVARRVRSARRWRRRRPGAERGSASGLHNRCKESGGCGFSPLGRYQIWAFASNNIPFSGGMAVLKKVECASETDSLEQASLVKLIGILPQPTHNVNMYFPKPKKTPHRSGANAYEISN